MAGDYRKHDQDTEIRLVEELDRLRSAAIPRQRDDEVTRHAQRVEHMAASGGGVSARDFERYLGRNDLVRINYLTRGLLAARAVCRLNVANVVGGEWGTGFLIAPRLLLTNNHVIGSAAAAGRTIVEFGYEADQNGFLAQGKRFRCAPEQGFITDQALDFTLVALEGRSEDGTTPLSDYGFLRLNPKLHKVEEEECVSIIQHPNGGEKFAAIRENKVLKIGDEAGALPDNWLWYASDTAPGSSGAPAFNDQWQVVAVHHRGVRRARTKGDGTIEFQLVSGEWIAEGDAAGLPDERFAWIANEGIRVSKIVAHVADRLTADPASRKPIIQDFVDDALGVRTFPGTTPGESIVAAPVAVPAAAGRAAGGAGLESAAHRRRPLDHYDGRAGYDPMFLGTALPLPELTDGALHFGQPAEVHGTDDHVLRYTHFSVVFNQDRRLAFYTAVNIDGAESRRVPDMSTWYDDPRLPDGIQVGDEFYGNEPLGNWFDRGHLTRRLDPVWGSLLVGKEANSDTYHWTNCAPQYWEFNQGDHLWQGLENFILYNTDDDDLRASVFTGPVFSDDDVEHRDVLVPQYYWKVVVVRNGAGQLSSSAYIVSQREHARDIPFEVLPVGKFSTFQVRITHIEDVTGLAFPQALKDAEVFNEDAQPLRSLADIEHPRRHS